MDLLTAFLLSIALSFDSFAVSISSGLGCGQWRILRGLRFAFVLGLMQGVMVFIGWALANGFHKFIEEWDHWVAFVLLFILGGKMIYGAIKERGHEQKLISSNSLSFIKSFVLGVATSIDAIIAGVSIAFLKVTIIDNGQLTNVIFLSLIVMFITFFASFVGLLVGHGCRGGFGGKVGNNAELIGGIALIAIGVKILIEHIN